jgi:Holliday junction resolvase RusA-like endonuclease
MTTVRFVIPGEPVSWKRAKRGNGFSYTDPKDKAHREKIRAYARNAGVRRPFTGEVRLDVLVFTSLPPLDRRVGDRDNYLKGVQDALQGIAVRDDRQFCDGRTLKAQDASRPRTEVVIQPLPEPEAVTWDEAVQQAEDARLAELRTGKDLNKGPA